MEFHKNTKQFRKKFPEWIFIFGKEIINLAEIDIASEL